MQELSPVEWALRPIKKYSVFSGRAPRAEYWWYTLATTILSFLVDFIDKAAGDTSLISGAFNFALILPGLAVTVRRLHDVDRSGWWLLGFIVPIAALGTLGAAASMDSPSFDGMTASIVILGLVLVILGIVLLIFTIKPGTQGSNDYGPDPYGPHGLEEVFA